MVGKDAAGSTKRIPQDKSSKKLTVLWISHMFLGFGISDAHQCIGVEAGATHDEYNPIPMCLSPNKPGRKFATLSPTLTLTPITHASGALDSRVSSPEALSPTPRRTQQLGTNPTGGASNSPTPGLTLH
ncbi:hypothetical protein M0804_004069 [Polistes exclamans]|nr:hypothetical protein M0804_004069 [Polistes exclamans]